MRDRFKNLISALRDANTEELNRQSLEENNPSQEKNQQEIFLHFVRGQSRLFRKYYSIYGCWLKNFIQEAAFLEEKEKQGIIFWMTQYMNSLEPSNFLWMNPGAVQRFISTEGESLKNGFKNWLEDVLRGDPLMKITDDRAFTIGRNIATTPGYVVFRNELMELIQYAPTTKTTYAMPIVMIQPWINKYYIFDLNDQASFVRYLVNQGYTVFITSWRNPSSEMRNVSFEDYMFKGVLKAIYVARKICRGKPVHAAGFCIGGTALAASMAWLNAKPGGVPVADWTLFATLTDFSEPGDLGFVINQETIGSIEELMMDNGYLDGVYMALTFRMLRSESLIWRNYVHNYLYGGAPPKSDVLYWNNDCTRLPQAMCSFFLREFYVNNRLAKKNSLRLGKLLMDLGCIEQPLYVVGAQQDHICPWKSTFHTCGLVKGPVRYVLASEGHIAGIVNPPFERSGKKFWAGEADGNSEPDAWLNRQQEQKGSWWPDWMKWLSERNLPAGKPPPIGGRAYPPIEKAPGSYVLEK